MEFRNLGRSGLQVSVAGLGTNQLGGRLDDAESARLVHAALDAGVNLFDDADIYGGRGKSEVALGKALAGRRQDAVIVSKFGNPMGEGPMRAGGSRLPSTSEGVTNADLCIHMNGREVFRFATRILVESANRLLQASGLTVGDVDLLVAHQANERILDHASDKLGIARERVVMNLDRYGNTSSASIPLALDEARETGMLKEGALVLMVGFGAGLTWGSVLVRWEPRA